MSIATKIFKFKFETVQFRLGLNPFSQHSNLAKNQYGTRTHAKPESIPTEITHLISTLEAQVLDVSL